LKPVALFGGTFDPVHAGHIGLAQAALSQLETDTLVLLPAGNPYQKASQSLAPAGHRVAMLQLAFADCPGISVDERELKRTGATYTYDTLVELRREHGPGAGLVWLIGSDAFSRIDTWHRWAELFKLAHFAVIERAASPLSQYTCSRELWAMVQPRMAGLLQTHVDTAGAVVRLGSMPPPVSSTTIREKTGRRESIRGLTPGAVCDYIEHHRLYLPEEKTKVG
jgi:nicotinate-nucleotide adenylyltransferase